MNPFRFVNFSVLLQCLVIVIPLLEAQGANAGAGAYGNLQSQALGQTQEQDSPSGTHLVPVKRNIPAQYQQRSRALAVAPQGKGNTGVVDVAARKKRCEDGGCDDGDDMIGPTKPGLEMDGNTGVGPSTGNVGGSGMGIMCKCMCDGLPIDADAGSGARG